MKKFLFFILLALGALCVPVSAQQQLQALIVSACGTPPVSYVAGTYGILTMDTTGKLCDGGGGGGGGGTSSNFGAVFPSAGTAAGAEYLSSPPTLTTGQMVAFQTDVNGNLKVTGTFWPYTLGQQLAAASIPVVLTAAQITALTPLATVAATQSGTWTVQPGNTPNTVPWLVAPSASASGGATPYHVGSAASNNSTNVKASAGTVYDLTIINTTTTLGDFRFYDSASAPTCSSATGVVNNLPVQSNVISPGLHLNYPGGKLFANGISFCYTGAVADNDNTNAATGVQINIDYK
jgi:hypothetical protein